MHASQETFFNALEKYGPEIIGFLTPCQIYRLFRPIDCKPLQIARIIKGTSTQTGQLIWDNLPEIKKKFVNQHLSDAERQDLTTFTPEAIKESKDWFCQDLAQQYKGGSFRCFMPAPALAHEEFLQQSSFLESRRMNKCKSSLEKQSIHLYNTSLPDLIHFLRGIIIWNRNLLLRDIAYQEQFNEELEGFILSLIDDFTKELSYNLYSDLSYPDFLEFTEKMKNFHSSMDKNKLEIIKIGCMLIKNRVHPEILISELKCMTDISTDSYKQQALGSVDNKESAHFDLNAQESKLIMNLIFVGQEAYFKGMLELEKYVSGHQPDILGAILQDIVDGLDERDIQATQKYLSFSILAEREMRRELFILFCRALAEGMHPSIFERLFSYIVYPQQFELEV